MEKRKKKKEHNDTDASHTKDSPDFLRYLKNFQIRFTGWDRNKVSLMRIAKIKRTKRRLNHCLKNAEERFFEQ